MNTGVRVEQNWNERSQGLRKARAGRYGKHSLHRSNPKAAGDGILKKAKALERARNTKSPLSRYDTIPPLKPKLNAYERTHTDDDDEDSWGEASEDSDNDDYYPATHHYASTKEHIPQPYPLPPMSFALVPVPHPGSLGYRNTPPKRPKQRNYLKRKTKASQQAPTKQDAGVNTETQTDYEAQFRTSAEPGWKSDPQYQYIYVNPANVLPDSQELVQDAALKFYDDHSFAQRYTDDFVNSQLHDEIIPDLLIEVLEETYRQKPSGQGAPSRSYQPFEPQIHAESRRIPGEDEQIRSLTHQADISKEVANDLIAMLVDEEVAHIARETCSEHKERSVTESSVYTTLDKITDEIIAESCDSMFNDLLADVSDEAMRDQNITEPVVSDMLTEIAVETLQHYSNKQNKADIQELTEVADVKFLDAVMIDSFLEQLIKQERVHLNEIPSSNFALDGMMLDVILRRLIEIDISKTELVDVKPVQRYHERVVTDVVMDLLLNELCLNLDEDMKDFDEYEMGLSDYLLTHNHYDEPSILPQTPQGSLLTPRL